MNSRLKRIESILEREFSNEDFTSLVREVFTDVRVVAPDHFNEEFSNFSSHIEGSYHVGTYETQDGRSVIIHAVKLKRKSYVENSRSKQRGYVKRLIENGNADGAIVAFFTEGDSKWRLSFVRLDHEIKFDNGRINVTENITPAKRYSFIVGKNEPCHTAISRLDTIIHIEKPTLDDIEEAFSVEKVTKEFFDLYCEKYHQLREALEANPDFVDEARMHNFTSAQFAKKLMGQIVFLYFLQKKGWLGVNPWIEILTQKEYDDIYSTSGAKGRIVKEHLPNLYEQVDEDEYRLNVDMLDNIPDDAEEYIANLLPKRTTWGSGSKRFLRQIFEFSKKRGASFFDDYLEPLFYNTLNVNRGDMGYDPVLHCRVPFLSGGLFEPIDGYDWKNNNFEIPDELFSNRENDNDHDGDGILDIFDRYNFTMSEDEPLEREVAIDPEMLGKVFENLLDINDRKSKGAFYTPREIVHYMCQETLISYLTNKTGLKESDLRDFILLGDFMRDEDTSKQKRDENGGMYISEDIYKVDSNDNVIVNRLFDIDNALKDIRVVDPAVGSGAFPLGMLNEIVRARENISAYFAMGMNSNEKRIMYNTDRSTYNLKRETIKNCLFAADIEPSAVDIAQLRLWLSLVIDDEINPDAQSLLDGHHNPLPLPNLECNIICGNSLINEFEGVRLDNINDILGDYSGEQINIYKNAFESLLPELLEQQDSLFSCDDTKKKQQIKEHIDAIKDELVLSQFGTCAPGQWERYLAARKSASRPFILWNIDFSRVFREKGGFDVVIGNPPYVGEKGNKETFRPIAATAFGQKYYQGKMDLFYFFFHKAIDLGNSTAEISYITTNYYPTATGGKTLRSDFKKRTQIRKLINFNELKIFESALGQHNMITFLTKDKSKDVVSRNCFCNIKCVANNDLLEKILYSNSSENNVFDYYQVPQKALYEGPEKYIRISGYGRNDNTELSTVLSKISRCKTHLIDIACIKQGIVSGADKYTNAHEEKYHLGVPKGQGIFILHKSEVEALHLTQAEQEYVKDVYKNSQVSQYHIDYSDDLKVLYVTRDAIADEIPGIINHLARFKPILESKRETREGKLPWYSLHWSRDRFIFESDEKIVNSRRAKSNIFALETQKCYEQSDLMITVIKNEFINEFPTKYVLGLLNSKLYYVWLKNKGKLKGDLLELYGAPLEEIPLKTASDESIAQIVSLVDKLLITPDDLALREAIDLVVYDIYGLTSKEVAIVNKYV